MDEIELVPYQADWPEKFRVERDLILGCMRAPPLYIEHIGSTSVLIRKTVALMLR